MISLEKWPMKNRGVQRCRTAMVGIGLLLVILLLTAVPVSAGEIEPRAFVNTPVGVNFLLAGYVYSSGDPSTPGTSPVKDA